MSRRIFDYAREQLIELGTRVVEEHYCLSCGGYCRCLTHHGGVTTTFKNLILAAGGPNPELRFADAVSNTIEIVANAQFCLVHDRPLGESGLSWADLVARWAETRMSEPNERDAVTEMGSVGRWARSSAK